jgi:hypothetical protein
MLFPLNMRPHARDCAKTVRQKFSLQQNNGVEGRVAHQEDDVTAAGNNSRTPGGYPPVADKPSRDNGVSRLLRVVGDPGNPYLHGRVLVLVHRGPRGDRHDSRRGDLLDLALSSYLRGCGLGDDCD